jgi:hypothetical protein
VTLIGQNYLERFFFFYKLSCVRSVNAVGLPVLRCVSSIRKT